MKTATLKREDNGTQEFYESDRILVYRNHGENRWWASLKEGGGNRLFGQREIRTKEGFLLGWRVRTFSTAQEALKFAASAVAKIS